MLLLLLVALYQHRRRLPAQLRNRRHFVAVVRLWQRKGLPNRWRIIRNHHASWRKKLLEACLWPQRNEDDAKTYWEGCGSPSDKIGYNSACITCNQSHVKSIYDETAHNAETHRVHIVIQELCNQSHVKSVYDETPHNAETHQVHIVIQELCNCVFDTLNTVTPAEVLKLLSTIPPKTCSMDFIPTVLIKSCQSFCRFNRHSFIFSIKYPAQLSNSCRFHGQGTSEVCGKAVGLCRQMHK